MGLFLDSQFLDSLFLDCSTDKFAFSVLHYPYYCKVIVYFGIKWSKSRRKKKEYFYLSFFWACLITTQWQFLQFAVVAMISVFTLALHGQYWHSYAL